MFLHVPSFSFIFLHFPSFSSFSFIFLHFPSFSFIFLHFPSFSFIFYSCSVRVLFMFFLFLSFSFIFFHFLSLSFIFFFFVFVGCSKSDFFGPPLLCEKSTFGPISGCTPLGPLFLFFHTFSVPFFFFVFFLAFLFFSFFSFFVHLFIFSFFHFSMFFIFLVHFPEEKSFLFSFFSCISFKYFLLLTLVSECNCFLRSRCSMEMWCPDDIGRDSWDWVGPPAWGRACFNSPEWGGGSSPVKTEPTQIVLLLLLLL